MFTRHFAAALTRACAACLVLFALANLSLGQEPTPAAKAEPPAAKAETPADTPTAEAPEAAAEPKAPADEKPAPEEKAGDQPGEKESAHKDEGDQDEGHKEEGHKEAGHEEKGHEEAGGDAGHKAEEAGEHKAGDHKAGDGESHKGGSHAAHHDDPGHGNAAAGLEAPEEYKWDLAIYSFVVFLLLLAILFRFAWGPIMEGLDKREASVAENIRAAEANAAKSEQMLRDHEAKMAEAAEETKKIIDKAKADAERSAQRIVEQAEEAAARERERAVADIESAKSAALAEVSEKSVDIALGLAGGIVRKNLDRDQHAELIREALDQFPSQN